MLEMGIPLHILMGIHPVISHMWVTITTITTNEKVARLMDQRNIRKRRRITILKNDVAMIPIMVIGHRIVLDSSININNIIMAAVVVVRHLRPISIIDIRNITIKRVEIHIIMISRIRMDKQTKQY